jgi:ATP-binding cassette, subfamily B, bacterial
MYTNTDELLLKEILAFPFYRQQRNNDCGPACLKMIGDFYKLNFSFDVIREKCLIENDGVSLLNLSEAANYMGFKTLCVKLSLEQLKDIYCPCIANVNSSHFVVVIKIKDDHIIVADPAYKVLILKKEELFFNKKNIINNSSKEYFMLFKLNKVHEDIISS